MRRVGKADRVAGGLRAGVHLRKGMGGRHVEGQHPALEQRQHLLGQGLAQLVAPPPRWQRGHAGQQLGQRDAGQVQRGRCLGIQPGQHRRLGRGPQRFGDDVRVEDDHLKLAGTTGVRSRSIFSATPPTLRPTRGERRAQAVAGPHGGLEDVADLGFGAAPVLRGALLQRPVRGLGQVSHGDGRHGQTLRRCRQHAINPAV